MAEQTSKTKEFTSKSGKKYVFQKVTPIKWLDILDEAEASGRMKRSTFYPLVLESVVVQPQLKADEFEDSAELEEVVTEATRFQQGK